MNYFNAFTNYLWSFISPTDPKDTNISNTPNSTQSYTDTSSDSDSGYYDTWEDDDSGYGSEDPFFALLLVTLYSLSMRHKYYLLNIIKRVIFKSIILTVSGLFGYAIYLILALLRKINKLKPDKTEQHNKNDNPPN